MIAPPRARRCASPSFGSVLAEVESGDGESDRLARPLGYPFAAVDPPAEAPEGAANLWDQALAWVEGPGEPPLVEPAAPRAEPAPPLTDDPDAIAAELGLSAAPTLAELSIVRRRFMWANHPDRRRDAPRELANRRVAIANMLLDRAEAALAVRRRRS